MTENQNIEWKENWQDEYIKWICGFANAFFRTGLIDAWGRSIQKINSECQRAGSPVPDYRYDYSGFFLVFNVSSHDQSVKTSVKTSVKILELISTNSQITIPELADEIDVTERSIERNIWKLQQSLC